MDSVKLILAALQVTSTVGNLAVKNDVVKDAYVSLRDHIQQKFVGRPGAELALSEYETDPETWEAPLKKALMQVQADQDAQVMEAVLHIMKFMQPRQTSWGIAYNGFNGGGTPGLAIGDYQSIAVHSGDDEEDK